MADSALSIRTLAQDDIPAFNDVLSAAFQGDPHEDDAERLRTLIEPGRWHGIHDGDELIGGGGILTRDITLPGAQPRPTAAVTGVGVKPGHRRRGVLSLLMRTQLHELHEQAREAFAVLWASEGAIYPHFGYGLAAEFARLAIPRGAKFHSAVDLGTQRVREVSREEAWPFITELYDRVRVGQTGWLGRTERSWQSHLRDEERDRDGLSAYRYVVHPQGYAIYRIKHDWQERGPRNELHLRELTAETDEAYAALYRYLLDVDLVGELQFFTASDDPIVHLLKDSRAALRKRSDSLWVRLVDLDRALPQRTYQSDVDAVLDVTDELCPWNADRWRLTIKSGEASVQRVADEPDVALDIDTLGAVFLGGTRLSVLARAQRVRELTPGVVGTLTHAFLGDREPHCPEVF